MNMICGFDVSSWQQPNLLDWKGMQADENFRFIVARASYGKGLADKQFVRFAQLADEYELTFGAYHFVRQIHSAEEQLALFDRQIRAAGGLHPGDLYPVLDLEENSKYDGKPKAQVFSDIARKMAEALKAEYGNVILYYSSFFPEWFGSHRSWLVNGGYLYWLADYNSPEGKPRTPYQPEGIWHMHQPNPRKSPFYRANAVIDHDVVNPTADFKKLLIPEKTKPDVSNDAKDCDAGTNDRPGGAPPLSERLREGVELIRDGLEAIEDVVRDAPGRPNSTGGG